LQLLNAPDLYATDNFAQLLKQVSTATTLHNAYHSTKLFDVFVFHVLLQRQQLVSDLLITRDDILKDAPEDNGVTIFEIADVSEALNVATLAKILDALGELCRLIELSLSPQRDVQSPRLLLLDSGSSKSLAIQT